MVDKQGDTMTGNLEFDGTDFVGIKPLELTQAQIDTLPTTGSGIVKNTTTGEYNILQSGSWVAMSSGSTQPNASTTIAGKVEIATQIETDAGTVV